MRYDAILFDMDGTLLSSGPLWDRATRAVLPELGIHLSDEEYLSLGGVLLHDLLAAKGYDEEMIEHVRQRRDAMLLPLFREETVWRRGARELLADLADVPTAVVTSAHAAVVDAIDEGIGIRSAVNTMIVYEDVFPRYKPDPLGLLLACEQLNVTPGRCVYVGDQACDLGAAKAAGMDAVLIRGPHTPGDLLHDPTIGEMTELKAIIG